MLNFRNINILFVILLAAAIWYDLGNNFPVYFYIIIFLVYSLILFYGSYFVGSNFYIKILCSADTEKKQLAISFDDGPSNNYTQTILDILRRNNTEAAFFCIGSRVSGNDEMLEQIVSGGHIIGNHSYSHHFWFDLFSAKKMLADMRMMDLAVHEATGLTPRLFRPPYGVTNPNVAKAIVKGNYIPVGWSIRSMDTVIKDETKLLNKLITAIKPGAILLFHDTSKTTVAILPDLIKHIHDKGYEIVRLDKMLNVKAYA